MRGMRAVPVICFVVLLSVTLSLTAATLLACRLEPSSPAAWLAGAVLVQLYGALVYRLFLRAWPLAQGDIAAGSAQEAVCQVHVLFHLILFNTVVRSGLLPIPLMRLVYLALGAKLGAGSYSSGIICDPLFVRVGARSILGEGTLLVPHVIERRRLAHFAITIGNDVTVGAHAVILAGASIGDGALIAANSVVLKGATIGPGEVWGGSPARPLKRR